MAALADPKLKDKQQQPGDAKPDAELTDGDDKLVKEADVPVGKYAMELVERSLGISGRKKKEKPKPNIEDEKADDESDELPPPKTKPAPKPKPTPAIDEEKLAQAVGRSVAEVMDKRKPAEPLPPSEPELPSEVKDELQMYERLEKHFPEKYKGHAKKFLANAKKFTEYSEKWENEHPGQEFNDADSEHQEFRSKLEAETEYDVKDDSVAIVRETLADEKKKWREEVDKELAPLKEREKLAAAEKDLTKAQTESSNQFWTEMAEEFPGAIDPKTKVLNETVLRAAADKNPEAARLAFTAASDASAYAREIHLLDNNLTPYLGEEVITEKTPPEVAARIRAHRFLSRRAELEEAEEAARQRLDKRGRPFVTRAQYNKLSPAEQAKVWRFTTNGLSHLLTLHIADEIRNAMKKTGAEKSGEDEKAGDQSLRLKSRKPAADDDANEEERDEKPLSPSTPIAPRLASSRGKPVSTPTEPVQGFVMRSIRGR